MKSKVMLFDADGTQVGETFTRRARQLVNQQRAEWIGESSIRFAPDAAIDESEWAEASTVEPRAKEAGSEALLYYLASSKVKKRRAFIMHSILLFPGIFMILIMSETSRNNEFAIFMLGAWLSPYFIHAFMFIQNWLNESLPGRVEKEVNKLRRAMK